MALRCWQQRLSWFLLLEGLALCNVATVNSYSGFDCGQGTALLLLASTAQCGSGSHVACFNTVAMKVHKCSIKAWPHKPHKHHWSCWNIHLMANVTNVNTARGTINRPMAAAGGDSEAVPVALEFRRADESMHLQFGRCSMRFNVQAVTDASLMPAPGEEEGGVSSLLVLLLPAILVPCMCVGLIVAVGSVTAQRMRRGPPSADEAYTEHLLGAGSFTQKQGQPRHSSGAAHVGRHGNYGRSHAQAGLGLFTRTFNLKAMSKRALAKRLRRSARPMYVGHPHEHAKQQREYAAGKLQPGPCHLVAPCFRFPPVAVAPGLEAIPELHSPSPGPSALPTSDMATAAAAAGVMLAMPQALVRSGAGTCPAPKANDEYCLQQYLETHEIASMVNLHSR